MRVHTAARRPASARWTNAQRLRFGLVPYGDLVTADLFRRDAVLQRALWWLTGWPLTYRQGPAAALLPEWDQLLAEFDEVLAELGDEDQAAAGLRAVVTMVTPMVEAWHAGEPIEELAHDELSRQLERSGRRIEHVERGEPFDEYAWEEDAWWSRSCQYARVWTERLGSGPAYACQRVLELMIAAARTVDPAPLAAELAKHEDYLSLRRWLADNLTHPHARTALDLASNYTEDPTVPPRLARIELHDGLLPARFVLHDLSARPADDEPES